jgi:predicted O-methyltransferase YrrM
MNLFQNMLQKLRDKGFLFPSEKSWHSELITTLARELAPKRYLEVGVYRGETIRGVSGFAKECVGIDIDPMAAHSISNLRNVTSFTGSLQQYVNTGEVSLFELIFIDADHSRESVISDFNSAKELISDNGVILLHDTWPKSFEFTDPKLCGDAYLAVSQLRVENQDWSFVTLPIHPGLTLCQKNDATPFR